uniref:Uncharacterized protein n=1 Tax=Chromera velia CCMP2878 TaxID=1169474 RepID=A0A0G4FRY3_9ALVE|eukprot:Cvel_3668.t1-p1 / transcript=Cvel_3668.t1 / gene=Cvel_3668 / organism=Chromera_velia_CCMP2878 / gene_product=hypothetical protein / transcript_product=hypothetical protein / location=Cvel_scaffold152:68737-75289(+) / protein_length=113 / sequence_SO=supercontig / SO=protein_coding / is_pseudo=false
MDIFIYVKTPSAGQALVGQKAESLNFVGITERNPTFLPLDRYTKHKGLTTPHCSNKIGDPGKGDAGALEALWVLGIASPPRSTGVDGSLGGASHLCASICVEPDGVPPGVSLR